MREPPQAKAHTPTRAAKMRAPPQCSSLSGHACLGRACGYASSNVVGMESVALGGDKNGERAARRLGSGLETQRRGWWTLSCQAISEM